MKSDNDIIVFDPEMSVAPGACWADICESMQLEIIKKASIKLSSRFAVLNDYIDDESDIDSDIDDD